MHDKTSLRWRFLYLKFEQIEITKNIKYVLLILFTVYFQLIFPFSILYFLTTIFISCYLCEYDFRNKCQKIY